MKLASLTLALLAGVSTVYADFHVGRVTNFATGAYVSHRACPSSKYGCSCFLGGGDGSRVILPSGQNQLQTYFQVVDGWCRNFGAPMPRLDFYKRSDGRWEFYQNGGNGALVGTCYSNSAAQVNCGSRKYTDNLVCYTSWCN